MYGTQNYGYDNSQMGMLGEPIDHGAISRGPNRPLWLDGSAMYAKNPDNRVAPAPGPQYSGYGHPNMPVQAFESAGDEGIVFGALRPILYLMRAFGLFPIGPAEPGILKATPTFLIYSAAVFAVIMAYVGYIKWDRVDIVRSAEGKFEEVVIDYLFSVYLVPVVIIPLALYESAKVAKVYTNWIVFESIYQRIASKKLPLFMGNRPLMVALVLPILGCGTMVVTHVTMVHFRFIQVGYQF